MAYRNLIFISSLLLLSLCASAAEYSRYLVNHSVEEGLSQSLVNQTLQDNNGFIWVATEYGLNRFDGYNFEQIKGPNNSFSSDGIVHMALLSSGQLFISTYYNGAYLLNPLTLQAVEIFSGKLSQISDVVMSVDFSLEREGSLWWAVGQHLVEYDLDTKLSHVRYSMGENEHAIRALMFDNGLLFMGTTKGLKIYDVNDSDVYSVNHLPANVKVTLDNHNVKTFYHDKTLGLLIGTVQGLYSFDLSSMLPKSTVIAELNIWGIIGRANELFIGSQRGLYSFDKNSEQLTQLLKYSDVNPLITNNSIKNIYLDHSGLMWLSSQIQGVFTFDPKVRNFSSYSRLSSLTLSNSVVYDYIEVENGIYWVATGNGLNLIDSNTNRTEALFVTSDDKAVFGEHTIFRIFPDKNSKVWLWHGGGLSLFDLKKREKTFSSLKTETNEQLVRLAPYGMQKIASDKFAFVSNQGHFLLDVASNRIEPISVLDSQFKPEGTASFLPSMGDRDSVLVATTGGLINYNFIEKSYDIIYQINGFHIHDYKYVSSWERTDDGHTWLAVNGVGLVELDEENQVVQKIDEEGGLSDLRIYGLIEDKNGIFWISSQSGLYQFNRDTRKMSHYSAEQGLVSNEVYEITKRLSNGKIAFNSAAGMVMFSANELDNHQELSMPVNILRVDVASQETSYRANDLLNNDLTFNHDDYGVKFIYSNFNYALQKKVVYQVSLTGNSDIFFDDFSKNSIEFNRLNPGDYQFSVRAKSPVTGELSPPAVINFRVLYNPWLSPLAYTLYIVSLLASFLFLYIRRAKKQFALQAAHDEMLLAKQKAELALEASNSGVWIYDHATQQSSQNRLLELGHSVPRKMVSSDFLTYIHPDDRLKLRERWGEFIAGKTLHWDVLYRLMNSDGDWVWYRDLGKACVTNSTGDNLVFTGTYTNVTATKSNEYQAQLYGQALQKMNEWLLILDSELQPVISNPAFNKRFLKDDEILNRQILTDALGEDKLKLYVEEIKKLSVNEKLLDEVVLTVPAGFDIPVLISISAIGDTIVDSYVIVISDLSEQKKVEDELKYLASFDPLTHLANRTLIREYIEHSITSEHDEALALLFLDLDRFKQVNDLYGHAVGDQLLVEVAHRIKEVIGDKHRAGRQSGDEFIVILSGLEAADDVSRYADKLIERLSQPYVLGSQTIHTSCSIGMAFYPFDSKDCDELMQNADIAMLHAKKTGRNCYRFFTDEMNVQIRQRVILENELVWAVKDNALTNYYQPIVDIESKTVIGVELLLRWFNGDEMISPAQFIPMAENIGKIVEITELALAKALKELKGWLSEERYLSINLSALHINQPHMLERLLTIVKNEGALPSQLRLEITEGILIDDTQNAKQQLTKLKNAGFKLFLDDFGTGYSSLTYINQFPIDVIKIDQCFIREIANDEKSRAIVQTIVHLANNIHSHCVVEGVETREQLLIIQQLGCCYVQGYFFARPMPISDLCSEDTRASIMNKLEIIPQHQHEISH